MLLLYAQGTSTIRIPVQRAWNTALLTLMLEVLVPGLIVVVALTCSLSNQEIPLIDSIKGMVLVNLCVDCDSRVTYHRRM